MDKWNTKKCIICGCEISGASNNAEPIAKGFCCDKCNQSVIIPARVYLADLSARIDKECERTGSKRSGIDKLLSHYIKEFGWTQAQAMEYIIGLYTNGTIDQLMVYSGANHKKRSKSKKGGGGRHDGE